MPAPNILHFPDSAELARQLAEDVAAGLAQAIATRDEARLVVSGGKSPIPFFEALRTADLAWAKVRVTLADERWIATEAPDSNERLVREHLLKDKAAAATLIGLKQDFPTAVAGCTSAWHAALDTGMEADELILGMGEDGHTASLFPGMPDIEDAMNPKRWCGLVPARAPVPPTERISLNLSALLSARSIRLQIPGAAKRALLERILAAPDAGRWPVSAVLNLSKTPVTVYTSD
jgi:6-phosphogluconolactonase